MEATYETLGGIVGEDLAEHLDPGEELAPPVLGFWPDIAVAPKLALPPADAGRTSEVSERLAKCKVSIRLDGPPRGFDPATVSTLRALFDSVGPCLFMAGEGSELSTSEALLEKLAETPDLAATLRAVAAGEIDGGADEDEDEDEDDEADEDEDEEPATDSARPEMLRKMLAEVAQLPRVRRKVGELLASAPDIVGTFAERLARVGAEEDTVVAKALDMKEKEVLQARKALATILRRAEGR